MSQQQEISIEAEVMCTSNRDTSFFHQELKQRIENKLFELEGKSAQVATMENEIVALKASLTPILGVTFMRK